MDTDFRQHPLVTIAANTSGNDLTSGRRNVTWEAAPGRPLGGAYQWGILLLAVIVLLGLLGNLLVCIAITIEKRLQTVTNAFLMSLAVADLLVSILVMPCSMVHQLMGYWPFGLVMCDVWQVSDVMLCTSSIMHMCVISIDRYICIKNPLKTRITSKHKVAIKIAVVWLLGLAIASPIIVLGVYRPEDLLSPELQCGIFNRYFVIYGSLAAFFIPLLLMLATYSMTIHILRKKVCTGRRQDAGGLRRMMSQRVRRMSHVPITPRIRQRMSRHGGGERRERYEMGTPAELEPLNKQDDPTDDRYSTRSKSKNKYIFSALYTAAHGLALPVYQPIQGVAQKEKSAQDNNAAHDGGNASEEFQTASTMTDQNKSQNVPGIVCTNVSSEDMSLMSSCASIDSELLPDTAKTIPISSLGVADEAGAGRERNCVSLGSADDDIGRSTHRDMLCPDRALAAGTGPRRCLMARCQDDWETSDDCNSGDYSEDYSSGLRDGGGGGGGDGYAENVTDSGDGADPSQDRRSSRVVANDGFHFGENCILKYDKPPERILHVLGKTVPGADGGSGPTPGGPRSPPVPSSSPAVSPTTSAGNISHASWTINTSQASLPGDDRRASSHEASMPSSLSSTPQPPTNLEYVGTQQKLHTSLPTVPPVITVNGEYIQSTGSLNVPSSIKGKKRLSCPNTKDEEWKNGRSKKKSAWSRLSHPDTSLSSLLEPLRKRSWARFSQPNVSSDHQHRRRSLESGRQREGAAGGPAPAAPRFKTLVKKHSAAFRVVAILSQKRENLKKKEMRTVKTEQKAVKVLGTMFCLFVLCWAPFFSLNLAMGICHQSCSVEPTVFVVCLWLGYLSSILNPIIYTVFNKSFKETFALLLLCKYCKAGGLADTAPSRSNSLRLKSRLNVGRAGQIYYETKNNAGDTEMARLNNGRVHL